MFQLIMFHIFPISHRIIAGAALAIMIVGVALVTSSLAPFRRLRVRLLDIRQGHTQIIVGSYPNEIQPLVNDLNNLLEMRERAIRRAQAKAGDLAHGLKTPLAILSQEADYLQREGSNQSAVVLREQIDRMRKQVDYHLIHARAKESGTALGVRSSIRASIDGLERTVNRLHADRGITIHVEVPQEQFVSVEIEDLDEILGNLLDNACKWGQSNVFISSILEDTTVAIILEDDGAGIAPSLRDTVLQRGVRADEATPGSGLGLAIVRDLLGLYGGSIALDESRLGGLKVIVRLPRTL